jgi:hypothetical protein
MPASTYRVASTLFPPSGAMWFVMPSSAKKTINQKRLSIYFLLVLPCNQ